MDERWMTFRVARRDATIQPLGGPFKCRQLYGDLHLITAFCTNYSALQKFENPANGSWRIVQVLSTNRFLKPKSNPAHGSGRILQVPAIYARPGLLINSSDLNN